ncbi:MAG: succinyl-diaminopimelate desuccinylase [Actinomycetales bacterium]
MPAAQSLDLGDDVVQLTVALCDIESVSGNEGPLADAVEAALADLDGLELVRTGNVVVARTTLGRDERVVLAGHLDTVPLAAVPNLPTIRRGDELYGRGTCDMKGGVAVQLKLAAGLAAGPDRQTRDVTYVFYDGEEIEAVHNGLGRVAREQPTLLDADFAVLLEPSNGTVEGGCNGTMRVDVTVRGVAAHSARSWLGHNAIHEAATILTRLREYEAREVEVDGLVFREGLNAVTIRGGVAGNVIPDRCVVSVNYRFAPSATVEQAFAHLQEMFDGYDLELVDAAPGARPGLDQPAAKAFVATMGEPPRAKYGWTDVSRFSALGVPAVNFGPGDPNLAHTDHEHVRVDQLRRCEEVLFGWLTS